MRVDFIANYGVLEYITFNGNLDLLPTKNKVIDMESGKIKFMKRTELQKLVANHTTYITYANNRKTIPTLGK